MVYSLLAAQTSLVLADLRGRALRKLGVVRASLIDTEKDSYPRTRRWAEAIHRHDLRVQGLLWTSRQDDSGTALVLFGDRLDPATLHALAPTRALIERELYENVRELAEQIGVRIVSGRT